jgi:hypothetical protein
MKQHIGIIIIVVGWLIALYVGLWVMFAQPIIDACKQFDAGTLTAAIIGTMLVKCFLAGIVGSVIGFIGMFIGQFFLDN